MPDKTAKALDDLSRATDRTRTYFIEKALESYLPSMRTTRSRSTDFMDKDDPIISSSEMRKRIGRRKR